MGLGSWIKEKVVEPVEEGFKDVVDFATLDNRDTLTDYMSLDLQKDEYEDFKAGEDNWIDPLDLFGYKAEKTESDLRAITEGAAAEGIETLELQDQLLQDLYQPYYEKAESALPILQQMIAGTYEGKPSKLYEYQKETGKRAIDRRRAAGGSLGSSGREEEMSNFYQDIASEEGERQYGGVLSQIKLGSEAADAIQTAGSTMSGNVGSLYSNLGKQSQAISENYGGARSSAYQTLANTLGNLAVYQGGQ